MKRYIKSNQESVIHISDLFDGILAIVVVNDVEHFNMSSITGNYIGAAIRYTDLELLALSDKELKSILDYKTLKQIVRLNNAGKFKPAYKYSEQQLDVIKSTNSGTFEIDKEDFRYTMERLTECPTLKIYPTKKNIIFETVFGMTDEGYKEIFTHMGQYYKWNTNSYDLENLEDNLMVFHPIADLVMYNSNLGKDVQLHGLQLYVKLDLDRTVQETVAKYGVADMEKPFVTAIVSFHLSDFDDNFDKYERIYEDIMRERRKSKK